MTIDTGLGPCWDARFDLQPEDLATFAHLLPASAAELVRAVQPEAAAALIHRLPGVQFIVPKHRAANPAGARRWAQLAEVIGQAGMEQLAATCGGAVLEVPICAVALAEKRNRWIRARYDELTAPAPGPAHSGRGAVYEIGIDLAAAGRVMTYRQIERVAESGDATADAAAERQPSLFPVSPALP